MISSRFFPTFVGNGLRTLMTKETNRLIQSLKDKTSKIIAVAQQLKDRNKILKEELEIKTLEADELRIALSEQKSKYEALKIAKSLNNNHGLKNQIATMVKEIDTCIELIEQ